MKTAVIQFNATADKQQNLERALHFIRQAAGRKAKFILLPEVFNYRGKADPREGLRKIAEDIPGPSMRPLMTLAKQYKVAILAGSICERIAGKKKIYNTSVLINDVGKIVAKYRKTHLFDAMIGRTRVKESRVFLAGEKMALVKIGMWAVGLTICYDLRFPELYRKYAKAGAEVLCVPSAFTKITGQAHWETLLRARAIENLCYVLAPNQIGTDGRGVVHYGNSMIVDPWGRVVARASGDKEEIIFADLEKKMLIESRKVLRENRLIFPLLIWRKSNRANFP